MKQSFLRMVFRSRNLKYSRGALPVWAFFLLLFVFVFFTGVRFVGNDIFKQTLPLKEPPVPISLVFVGDIMMDRGIRSIVNKYFEGNYGALFENTHYIAQADIAFANLEGPVAEETTPRTGSKFSFRMAPESLAALKEAGFDVVSFSNNHVGDYGSKAFLETLTHLKDTGIAYAGAGAHRTEATSPVIFDIRGVRIGYLAFTDVGPDWLQAGETKPGIVIAKDPALYEIVAQAKTNVDILVASFHWGNEYAPASTRQETIARATVDAGADIVVGHHPHVMQRVEWYKDKLILYSLGNFIFDQYFSPHTMRGMVATVTIDQETKELTLSQAVSPLSKQYIPQALIPFDESMLVSKTFTP